VAIAPVQAPPDDAGTARGDRAFRPDVEGLRAVAVVLVVLYHAGLGLFPGGYVGVDVFFVISGFVITGLLLREQATGDGPISLARFYGRRIRRILPAATLVIVTTVVAAYAAVGVIGGNQSAVDARWTAVFLANFHFAAEGTNYLTALQAPSPLQNFWSLAVEEQFYLVYPALFLVVLVVGRRIPFRRRLGVALVVGIAASLAWSVVETGTDPLLAYFSPLTRAWELALGGLLAVATSPLRRIPRPVGAAVSWVGLVAILASATLYGAHTPYPGAWVAVPVVGAALVIAGGTAVPRTGAESVLGLGPMRWTGTLSYSLYLWHWPILILAAEAAGRTSLPFRDNIGWLLLAVAAAVATHYLLENPVRHGRPFRTANLATMALGVGCVVLSVTVATAPADLRPALGSAGSSWGGPPPQCWAGSFGQTSVPLCTFGKSSWDHTLVVYGDSHAAMWFDAMVYVAGLAHWKLEVVAKGACPVVGLPIIDPGGWGTTGGTFVECERWRRFAMAHIRAAHPDLVVLTEEVYQRPHGSYYSPATWQAALERTIRSLTSEGSQVMVLGNIPELAVQSPPQCLVEHSRDVQACSSPNESYLGPFNQAEAAAAAATHSRYVSVIPWFCSSVCTAIVGRYQVYWNRYHVTEAYTVFLFRDLLHALDLPKS
jgi:peptidoglycan/LPS O-acetylase OafA/YrhL